MDMSATGLLLNQITTLCEVVTDLQGRLGVKQRVMTKDWEGEIDPIWPLSD